MFDTVKTLHGALSLFIPMIATMKVRKENMRKAVTQDFSNATDLADYLVNKGLPFRQAHEVVGKAVLYCIQENKYLLDLTMEEYKQFSELFEDDIYHAIDVVQVVNARNVLGGTAKNQVEKQIAYMEEAKLPTEQWIEQHKKKIEIDL